MKPNKLCLVMIFTGVFNSAVCESRAQSEEWEQIRAAIEARRQNWGRFRCQLNTVRVLPKEFKESAPTTLPEYSNGMFVVKGQLTAIVDVSGRRFHKYDRTPIFSHPRQEYVTRTTVTAFDGMDAYTWYPDHETATYEGKGPYDLIHQRLTSAKVRQFTTGPIFWSFGIFDNDDFPNGEFTDLAARQYRFSRSGDLVSATGTAGSLSAEYTFDLSRGASVVSATFTRRGDGRAPRTRMRSYQVRVAQTDGEWFPAEWQKTFHDAGEEVVTVSRLERLHEVDAALFTVPDDYLQPGMAVSDPINHERYLVGENHTREPIVSGRAVPVVESTWSRIGYRIAIVMVAIASVLLAWRARRV